LQAFSLRHQLCPRERQIVQLTAEGSSRKEMAKRLGLKPTTINTYCDRLHKKLGVQHATELSSLIYEFALSTRQ
jgi:DNA-binding CsgD family transcriptional regulator